MRRIHGSWAPTMAMVALLALSACSGGDDARSLGPVPTAPSTSVEPTTTTSVPTETSTTAVRGATTTLPPGAPAAGTTAKPVLVNGAPQVTASPPRAAASCADVGFAPNSDDLATDIVATGVGCVEAEALVRNVGAQVRSVGGPSQLEADGWACVRTSENDPDRGLPSSDFECVTGSKKVTFRRL